MANVPFLSLLVFAMIVIIGAFVEANDMDPIPAEMSEVDGWFSRNVLPLPCRPDLLPKLAAAESNPVILHVRLDGTGDFRRVIDAVMSIPDGNTRRTLIVLGSGTYTEKVLIPKSKPFVTLYGDPENMPTIVFDDTAGRANGTFKSATVRVLSDHFTAAHVIFKNSAPRPVNKDGDQVVALNIDEDMASFYGCHFLGFQDTLADNTGRHFFMDCYIEGTVDFIFGLTASSIYLRTEAHVVSGNQVAFVTANGRVRSTDDGGFSFVHSRVTGVGSVAYLGRPWRPYARVIFSYSEMTDVVRSQGWFANSTYASTVNFMEYMNFGPGSVNGSRDYARVLTDIADARRYLTLGYISGSGWLLPPPVMEQERGGVEPPHHSRGSLSYSTSSIMLLALCMHVLLV